ncbi:MAG: HNH endonuclease signature motif containing protein [Acidobacteriota bacterium]
MDVIGNANNRCCVCQTPFIQIHHIDSDPSNNDPGNLAPLCPNCHNQAHVTGNITLSLSASRITALRDRWYRYCEQRKDGAGVGPNAILKLKNFVRASQLAEYGWATTFASVDLAYKSMKRDDIIDHVFATTNRDDLVTYLATVKQMYQVSRRGADVVRQFEPVCHAFGIGYEELE